MKPTELQGDIPPGAGPPSRTKVRVLIVEDSPIDADLNLRVLRKSQFEPEWTRVETESAFLAALDAQPEVILCDYKLPQFDGLRAAELLRESGRDIPFILISGIVGEEIAVEAMRLGVTDYLLKDRIGRLGSVVERALNEKRLRDEHRCNELEKRRLAETKIAILNALPAHIALLDRNGVITMVNEAWRSFALANALQSPDFCVGQNYIGVCEAAHGECAEESKLVARGIRQVLSGAEKLFALEFPCHSPTEKRWFRLLVTPLSDHPGAGAVVMHVNVTDRRVAEEALRKKEREQRQLAETLSAETQRLHESQAVANVGSWETNLITLEVTWTEETYRIFEVSPDEFQTSHRRFLEFVHPDDRAKVEAAFVDSQDRTDATAIEHRICVPGGRTKFVEERWQTFNDERGNRARAVGTCQDITARKLAEEVIRIRVRQQEVIARIGFEATRATTLDSIFDFATRAVADALDTELCKVLQLTPDGRQLRLVSGVGWQLGLVGVATVEVDEASQAGFTLKSDGPIFVNDFRKEKRFTASPLLVQHKVISGLNVTIPLLDKSWGVLGAYCRSVRNFDDQDAQFMQSVASLLSVVIERLAVQRSLSDSESQMRNAQRIAHLANWELEIAANRLTWSDEIYRIFGVTPENFTGTYEAFRAIIHPEDLERVDAAQQRALAGEGILEIDHRIIRPNGEIRHVREQGELIHDEQGRPVMLSGTVLDITAQVQSDAKLADSQRRYRELVETSHDLIYSVSPKGQILFINETSRDMLGYAPKEMIGKHWVNFIPADRRAQDLAVFAKIIESGDSHADYLAHLLHKNGSTVVIRANSRTLLDDAGKIIGRTGNARNVTQSIRAEDALRESEERFRKFFEFAPDAIYLIDSEGRFVDFNQAAQKIVGYQKKELIGKSFLTLDLLSPDELRRATAGLEANLRGETAGPDEYRLNRKDGSTVWVEIRSFSLKIEDQTLILGIARDITDRKKSEQSLRLLSQAVEQSPAATVITDRQGNIEYVNEIFLKTTGYTMAEVEGINPRILKGGKTPPEIYRQLWETITTDRTWHGELHNRKKNGDLYWESAIISPVLAPDGQTTHFLAVKEDITERKKTEAAMRSIVQIQQELAMSDLPEQSMMELTAKSARELTDAAGSVVELVDGAEMVYKVGTGLLADKVGLRLKREGSLSGLALKTSSIPRTDDTETDPRCDLITCRKLSIRSMVAAPLMRMGTDFLGVIKVVSDRPAAFTDRDVNNLQILTETLGAVIQRRRAAEELQRTLDRLNLAIRAGGMGVWDWDVQSNHLVWDDRLYQIYGVHREDFSNAYEAWAKTVHPDDLKRSNGEVQAALRGEKEFNTEFRVVWPDGGIHHISAIAHVIRDADGTPLRMIGFNTDITPRKLAEAEIFRTNRALKILSSCNEAMMRAENEGALLRAFCDNCREIGGYRMAWVGYAEHDDARTIRPMCASGDIGGYLTKITLSWDAAAPGGTGPAGRAIREQQVIICEDVEQEVQFFHFKDIARENGFRSVICLPLRREGKTFGLLTLYGGETVRPSEEETKLLTELADDLAFGIATLRARDEQRRLHDGVLAIAQGVSSSVGLEFFESLNQHLVTALRADVGFIAVLQGDDRRSARTLSAMVSGKFVDNFDYELTGTPCEKVLNGEVCMVDRDVRQRFPKYRMLADLGAEAYAGIPLKNSKGTVLGLMAVLFRRPITEADFITSTLQIFAARAASEIERQQADFQVREQAALLDKAQDAILVRDLDHRITFWNHGAERLYGWSAAEALGRTSQELFYRDTTDFLAATKVVLKSGEWVGEIEQRDKAGRRITVEGHWTLVCDNSGLPKAVLAINTNITERKQTQEQIAQALRTKEVLLKEIHHRVKNNLQVISSLLALQTEGVSDANASGLLMESQHRVRAMAMIHEKLYQSSDLARVDFNEYVNSLVGFLFRSYSNAVGRVALEVSCDPVFLNIDTASPCGLIINELVSNALKHAFPDGRSGELRVELRQEEGAYSLTVSDTGVGLPPDFDWKRTNSLGLQLVDTLTRQLKGNMKIGGSGGASFRLDFKELVYSSRA